MALWDQLERRGASHHPSYFAGRQPFRIYKLLLGSSLTGMSGLVYLV